MKNTNKNSYFFRSHISERKFREIIRLFSADLTASQIAYITKINRNTINKILQQVRTKIAQYCETEKQLAKSDDAVEMDESYFGARRIRGKRGRGARGKIIVFGIKKRRGKVYTKIVSNCSKEALFPMIKSKIHKEAIVFTDGFKTYDSLVNFGYKKHYRVYHGKNEFASLEVDNLDGEIIHNHINGIENFWGIIKVRLYKFRGMNKKTFYLHLKESEFRFNHRQKNIYKMILDMLRKSPLN